MRYLYSGKDIIYKAVTLLINHITVFINHINVFNNHINKPRHAKTCLRAYADSERPDQPAHPRSPIRAINRIIGYSIMHDWKTSVSNTWRMMFSVNLRILTLFEGTLFAMRDQNDKVVKFYYRATMNFKQ